MRVLSWQHQHQPLGGHDGGFRSVAYGYVEAQKGAMGLRLHSVQDESPLDLRTHRHRGDEPDAVEPVVDVLGESQFSSSLVEEVGEEGQHHEAVCDRTGATVMAAQWLVLVLP